MQKPCTALVLPLLTPQYTFLSQLNLPRGVSLLRSWALTLSAFRSVLVTVSVLYGALSTSS